MPLSMKSLSKGMSGATSRTTKTATSVIEQFELDLEENIAYLSGERTVEPTNAYWSPNTNTLNVKLKNRILIDEVVRTTDREAVLSFVKGLQKDYNSKNPELMEELARIEEQSNEAKKRLEGARNKIQR